MGTARLETFSDGVFAIAATLLILNVDGAIKQGTERSAPTCSTRGPRTSATR